MHRKNYNNAMAVDTAGIYIISTYGKNYSHLRRRIEREGMTIVGVKLCTEIVIFIVKDLTFISK